MKKSTRLLSIILAVLMIVSTIPFAAFAEETTTYVAQIGETKYETLQNAINAVQNGDTITFLTDINEKVTIKQKANTSFTIDGAGKTYTTTMTVNGTGKASNQSQGLTIKNVNFVANAYAQSSIYTTKSLYARNITVNGCAFTGTGDAEYATYGIYLRDAYNIVVKNTTGTKMYDLAYGNTSVTDFQAEDVNVTDSKQGIWLSYVDKTATFKNINMSDILSVGIGIKNGQTGTVTIEDCNIDAVDGAVAFEPYNTTTNTKKVTLVFKGTNNLTNDEGNWLLASLLDQLYGSKVTVNLTEATYLNVNNISYGGLSYRAVLVDEEVPHIYTFKKFTPVAEVVETGVKYESLQEAINDCTNGETVKLLDDITYTEDNVVSAHGGGTGFGKYDAYNPCIIYTGGEKGATDADNQPSNVNAVLDLNGHTITNNADAYLFLIMDNAKLTFKDSGDNGSMTNTTENPVIWAVGTDTLVTIESGAYTTADDEGLLWSTHGADMVITGGNFATTADDASMLIVRNEKNHNNPNYFVDGKATVTIKGGTFDYNPENTKDDSTDPYTEFNACAEGYEAVDNGNGTWTVTKEIPALPTATVTKLENTDLTFALNFKADEVTEEQLAYYGDWYADFVLTVNKDVTFNANGGADGYLSGRYAAWNDNSWVNVPFEDVTLEAGKSLKIMEYAAELMDQSGLQLTYNDVYNFVKDFDCGVYFTPAFLAANPDLEVTLELRMYNPEDESESHVIGKTYTFTLDQYVAINMNTSKLYTSLRDAFAAAEDGATIKILRDHTIEETAVLKNGIDNVTLDLNGCRLNAADGTIPAIRVNGELTVTGDGEINTSSSKNVYCFIVGQNIDGNPVSGTLTIENGTFHGETSAVSVTAGTLYVKGGHFSASAYEGSYAYVLNCVDANYNSDVANINVTGGTFANFDPANNASEGKGTDYVADGYMSVADETNGTWSVVAVGEAVAINVQTREHYLTVAEALAEAQSGETVQLLQDCSEDYVLVTPGTTLDLNGKALKADYVVGFNTSNVINSLVNADGKLIVPNMNNVVLDKNNDQMAVFNNGAYVFAPVQMRTMTLEANKFISSPVLGTSDLKKADQAAKDYVALISDYVAMGEDASGVSIITRVTYDPKNESYVGTQDYKYKANQVNKVMTSWYGTEYDSMFTTTFNSKELEDGAQNVTVSFVIVSGTGVEIQSDPIALQF